MIVRKDWRRLTVFPASSNKKQLFGYLIHQNGQKSNNKKGRNQFPEFLPS